MCIEACCCTPEEKRGEGEGEREDLGFFAGARGSLSLCERGCIEIGYVYGGAALESAGIYRCECVLYIA